MNDEIRATVSARLTAKRMSRADLARAINKTPQEITRALNGGRDGGGKIPTVWIAILRALDLQLTATAVDEHQPTNNPK